MQTTNRATHPTLSHSTNSQDEAHARRADGKLQQRRPGFIQSTPVKKLHRVAGTRIGLSSLALLICVACGDSKADGLFGEPGDAGDSSSVATTETCGIEFDLADVDALGQEDDSDDDCSNGIQFDVQGVSSEVADGTAVQIRIDGEIEAEADVEDGTVTFTDLTFPANGDAAVEILVDDDAECTAELTVTTECASSPTCEVTEPADGQELTADDSTAAEGGAFRTQVLVETNASDGELVVLSTGTDSVAATVDNGQATFDAVLLEPDGDHTLQAECFNDSASGVSDSIGVSVDSVGPVLDTDNISPVEGEHFGLDDDLDPDTDELEFPVCVAVESADAIDLDGDEADNICVSIGDQEPVCGASTSGGAEDGADGGCVSVECPGNATFTLTIEVSDASGNVTTYEVDNVSCASELPVVQIVNLADASQDPDEISLRLLAASMPDTQLKDADADTAGAQTDVVACTNATEGTARLLVGATGSELVERATLDVLEVDADGECPADLPTVVRFEAVTLSESAENADGTLLTMTQLQVEVTDQNQAANVSGAVNLWVDSAEPFVGLTSPVRSALCDQVIDSDTDVTQVLFFSSTAFPAELVVNVENDGTVGDDVTATSQNDLVSIVLPIGSNTLRASTTEPSGNVGSLEDCDVVVGDPPLVTWDVPSTEMSVLNANDSSASATSLQDADGNTTGWQGVLQVTITNLQAGDVDSGSIQFQVDDQDFGDAIALSAGTGDATTRTVTLDTATVDGGIPDGSSVTLRAVVTGTLEENSGVLRDLLVDTSSPTGPVNVTVAIGPNEDDRRRTRFALTMNAGGDGDAGDEAVEAYDIAYSSSPITTQAEFDAALDNTSALIIDGGTRVTGGGVTPGDEVQQFVDNLRIEQTYYFAVQAIDSAGNQGPVVAADSEDDLAPAIRARFNAVVLTSPSSEAEFGRTMDGSTDLTGDGLSELVVGSSFGNAVYIYEGTTDGYSGVPLVTITGLGSGTGFGSSVAVVGDINADTPEDPTAQGIANSQDIVITASEDFSGPNGTRGRAYVFFGRNWGDPANQNISVAAGGFDATIDGNTFEADLAGIRGVARLGDYNGDGADDFVVLAPGYTSQMRGLDPSFEGAAFVVLGSTDLGVFESLVVPDAVGVSAIGVLGAISGGALGSAELGDIPALGVSSLFGSGSSGLILGEPSQGNLYAIQNDSLTPFLTTDSASGVFDGGGFTGEYGISLSTGNVVSAASTASGTGLVNVFRASAAEPLPAAAVTLTDSTSSGRFGQVLVGNGFSGRPGAYSTTFLGDPQIEDPDLVVASPTSAAGAPVLYFISGSNLLTLSGSVDLATGVSDTTFDLSSVDGVPDTWAGSLGKGIRDANGDGFGDIAISEFSPANLFLAPDTTPIDGQVIVLY